MDHKKRNTLKIISGTAAVAMLPTAVMANCNNHQKHASKSTQKLVSTDAGSELTAELDLIAEPTLLLTNNTDELIIVRHIHPGIIHAGKNAYDINSVFERSAYAIRSGSTRRIKIAATTSTQAEVDFPRQRYSNQPQRVVRVTGQDNKGTLVNSSRSFYG